MTQLKEKYDKSIERDRDPRVYPLHVENYKANNRDISPGRKQLKIQAIVRHAEGTP